MADEEIVVRAILSPYHLKKNKLSRAAFEAPPELDEVSVSRLKYVPKWLAKAYAKAWVQRLNASPQKKYTGLALIPVHKVRNEKSEVIDSRNQYLGHADIKHGFIRKRGETLAPEIRKAIEDRLDELARSAIYIEDPYPNSIFWKVRG